MHDEFIDIMNNHFAEIATQKFQVRSPYCTLSRLACVVPQEVQTDFHSRQSGNFHRSLRDDFPRVTDTSNSSRRRPVSRSHIKPLHLSVVVA